jgi:hypothetical protein
MESLADYISNKITKDKEEMKHMKKQPNKSFLAPLLLLFGALLIASCTQPINNEQSNVTIAPYFDESQDIDLRHEGNTFYYSFMVDMPTPCYTVETKESILESYPEQVVVDVTLIKTDAEMCAEVITPIEVSGSIPLANKPASFSVTLKGELAQRVEVKMENVEDWRIENTNFNKLQNSVEYGFTLNLPNPCYDYRIDERVEGFTLNLDITIIPPKGDVMCIQVVEQKRVEGTVQGNVDEVKISIDSELAHYEFLG